MGCRNTHSVFAKYPKSLAKTIDENFTGINQTIHRVLNEIPTCIEIMRSLKNRRAPL